jgi:hypothetical protein
MSKKLGVAVAALFLTGVIVVAWRSSFEPPPASHAVDSAEPQPEPIIDVSSVKLFDDYHRNEVAADSLYKGRTLRVSGIVNSINKNGMEEIYLVLENGHDEFMGVEAKLKVNEASNAGLLSKGDKVSVVCQGGTMIIGTPILENCYLTQAGEQPTDATERHP